MSSTSSTARSATGASAIGIGAGLVWSFGAIAARAADRTDAFQYLIWRSLGVVLMMELIAALRGEGPVTARAFRSGRRMWVGNIMLFTASLAFTYAVKTTSANNAAFLSSTTPLIALVVARVVLRERLRPSTVAAVGVGLFGLVVMVWGNIGGGHAVGNVAAFASSVGFAGYAVCVRSDQARDWSPILAGYAVMMIGVCSVIALAEGRSLVPPASNVGLGLMHGAVFIVVGTLMFNFASRHVAAVPMTIFAQAEMVGVPVWAFLFLHERPRLQVVTGGLIVLLAIVGNAALSRATSTAPSAVGPPVGVSASTS